MSSKETSHGGVRNPENDRIQRWRWLLNQDLPLIGGWVHEHVLLSIAESALSGNAMAVQSVAMALARHKDEDVRRLAFQTLQKVNFTSGIDAAWVVWVETRSPALEQILKDKQHPAGNPASARLLSALCLEDMETVTRGSAELVPPLIAALRDPDPKISERAGQAIRALRNPASIDAFCRAWLEKRPPALAEIMQQAGYVAHKPPQARVYSALKINRPELLTSASLETISALVEARGDADAEIASRAQQLLLNLKDQVSVDSLCRVWSETRSPLLEEALLQAGYQARSPLKVRILAALKTGRDGVAEAVEPEGLPDLLAAASDSDAVIRARARQALEHLSREDTQEALALRFIQANDPLAMEVSMARGYAPREAEMRALFFFLTNQWAAYDELDYDQGLMRAVYEAAHHDLRQRIAARVQAAGRTSYLTILAGIDYRARADEVNPNEAALLVRVLAQNQEWARLWALVPELALPFGIHIMQVLNQSGWQPPDALERKTFEELAGLSRQPFLTSGPELARALPLALPRANLKITGRVNEVAFSPVAPVLAIASSSRKVVLWNFQSASIEKTLGGFQHSVGRVTYTSNGILACGERSNNLTSCAVGIYQDGSAYQLHTHEGSITVLEAVGSDRLLTAGRDGKVVLWDLANRRLMKETRLPVGWARNAAIAPDEQSCALLEERLQLYRLPDLRPIAGQPFIAPRGGVSGYKKSRAQLAAFSPDGKYILAGQHNGQVALFFHNSLPQRPARILATQFQKPVSGICFVPGHDLAAVAGSEGLLRFLRWPELTPLGTLHEPDGRLTSLHIAPNGHFMATGTSEASLRLWDLRVLDIPNLFAQPLASTSHHQFEDILALADYVILPEPVRNGLKFLRLLLQYRFRFDIHIEEIPGIQYGEFDIILD